jgi:hypothetical protein
VNSPTYQLDAKRVLADAPAEAGQIRLRKVGRIASEKRVIAKLSPGVKANWISAGTQNRFRYPELLALLKKEVRYLSILDKFGQMGWSIPNSGSQTGSIAFPAQ